MRKKWTHTEDILLIQLYLKTPTTELVEIFSRSASSIQHRWHRIKDNVHHKGHLTESKMRQRIMNAGGIYVSNYVNITTCCWFQCPTCGKALWKTPNHIKSRPGCPQCGYQKTSKALANSENEFRCKIATIEQHGYRGKYVTGYTRSVNKCWIECPKCNTLIEKLAHRVTTGKYGIFCKTCSMTLSKHNRSLAQKFSSQQIDEKFQKLHIKWLGGEYESLITKLDLQCQCGCVYKASYRQVVNSNHHACPDCRKNSFIDRRKYLEKDIVTIVNKQGGIYLGGFINTNHKIKLKCINCNSIFERSAGHVIKQHSDTKYCKCCAKQKANRPHRLSQKDVENRVANISIDGHSGKVVGKYVNQAHLLKLECPLCKKHFERKGDSVFNQKAILCIECSRQKCSERRRYTQKEAEQQALEAGVKLIGQYQGTEVPVEYECACGTHFVRRPHGVIGQQQIYCYTCSTRGSSKPVTEQLLPTIQHILQTNYKPEKVLEQKIDGWSHGIDILINDIAIEFDGYWYHRTDLFSPERVKIDREKRKEKVIRKAGLKLLRIKSGGNDIPTEAQLRKVLLNHFKHGYKKWTITLKSWKEAEKKHKQDQ